MPKATQLRAYSGTRPVQTGQNASQVVIINRRNPQEQASKVATSGLLAFFALRLESEDRSFHDSVFLDDTDQKDDTDEATTAEFLAEKHNQNGTHPAEGA